jgi:LPS-assembly protein
MAGLPGLVLAAPDWGLCSFPVVQRSTQVDSTQSTTEIEADQLRSENQDYLLFEGDVQLQRQQQSIRSDLLRYYSDSEQLQADGNVHYADDLFSLSAQQLQLDNKANEGLFEGVDFQLLENHARGSASRVERVDSDYSELYDVSYTTCDPGQNDWSLGAGKLQLDQSTGMGTAHHAVFRLGSVPVFYFPWVRFPINDQRMSGLLMPTFSHSDAHGDMLSLPIYWNQAENYDMTITPVWYSERGVQLNTENRYLFGSHRGELRLSWLDDDTINDERWYRFWAHESLSESGIQTSLLVQRVSDEDFLLDFDFMEGISDVDYLKSALSFSGQLAGWSAQMLFEEYQTVDENLALSSQPYKRLPRLSLEREFSSEDRAFQLESENEFVRFDREAGITGDRFHIVPRLNYALENDYFFIKPSLQLDFTQYELDNNSNDIDSLERSIPLLSIDTGLIFERLAGSSGSWIQTLEPRLYFLYVPYEDQSDLPNFDTSLLADSYNNLFINNRFAGVDRIGDSEQLSVGITTRLLNIEDGREMLSASIGQAYYADDRRVSLNNSIDDADKSSLMSLITYSPSPPWQIQLASVYDQQEKESEQTDIAFRRHQQNQTFNLEYHFRKDSLEQSTLSFVYPYSNQWRLFGKYQYSIRNERPVQNLAGLAYESCCWGITMLYEEESDTDFTETDRTVYFQFTFKGLSRAGNDINALLEDGILGYHNDN